MGIADRDYMRERRQVEEIRFTPPPAQRLSFLWMLLVWVGAAFALYKVYEKVYESKVHQAPAASQVTKTSKPAPPTATTSSWQEPQRPVARSQHIPAYPAAVPPPQEARSVTKCVGNGTTTYSDQGCAAGSVAERVEVNPNRNLSDGLPRSKIDFTPAPTNNPAGELAVANADANPHFKKNKCDALEARIRSIDAEARQPQSAQTQDRLAMWRKEARDEQFRLRC